MYVRVAYDVILSGANLALGGFVNPTFLLHLGVDSSIFRRTSPDFHKKGKPP